MSGHDLKDFLVREADTLAQEYSRIASRVKDDPGTAGDQGEENWAELLRKWLPPSLYVTTKGRVLATDNTASKQVDVVILSPWYPPALRNSKYYLADGVLAAFECKTTLRTGHVRDAFERCPSVKRTSKGVKECTARNILCGPTIYGLLAHAHDLGPDPKNKLSTLIASVDKEMLPDPYDMPDLFCVANLGLWNLAKSITPKLDVSPAGVVAGYMCSNDQANPIGAFLTGLYRKLAWRIPEMREIARYFGDSGAGGGAAGGMRLVRRDRLPQWFWERIDAHEPIGQPYHPWGWRFD